MAYPESRHSRDSRDYYIYKGRDYGRDNPEYGRSYSDNMGYGGPPESPYFPPYQGPYRHSQDHPVTSQPPSYEMHPEKRGSKSLKRSQNTKHSDMDTSAIMQRPPVVKQPRPKRMGGERDWSSGICSCCDDVAGCCAVMCCGICYACHLSMKMEENCCVPMCVPGWIITLRTKLRISENIQGSVCNDCMMAYCCGPCVMCQMGREIKYVNGEK